MNFGKLLRGSLFIAVVVCRLRYDKFLWAPHPGCQETGYDVIFTDIIAVKTFPPDVIRDHGYNSVFH